jgi:hypothetical protein
LDTRKFGIHQRSLVSWGVEKRLSSSILETIRHQVGGFRFSVAHLRMPNALPLLVPESSRKQK